LPNVVELEDKTRLGPPGVDTKTFHPRVAGGGVPGGGIVFVGKLIVSKGVDLLIAAWPLVHAAHPEAKLEVAGYGEYEQGLRRLLAALDGGDMDDAREVAKLGWGLEGGPVEPLSILSAFLADPPPDYLEAAKGMAESVEFIADRLGITIDRALRDRLIAGFHRAGEQVPLQVGAGLVEALDTLRSAGIRLGIVCDVGLTPSPILRARLDELGLLRSFDAWAFSDETGWFKPAEGAFAPALERLGADDPTLVAHIGDNRRTDVAGARALGMVAVRFTGFHDRSPDAGPEAHHVIDDHRTLPGLLGVG